MCRRLCVWRAACCNGRGCRLSTRWRSFAPKPPIGWARPLRKATPPLGRWDLACVLACVLVYYLAFTLVLLLALPGGFGMRLMAANLLFTVLNLFKAAAYVLLLGLLLRMVLSFSKPYSPLLPVLHRIFEPLSRPFVFLKIGRFDFSGSVLVLVLWFWLSAILPQMISRLNLWLLG